MISVVRNSIRNSVKQCASPKRTRSKSSLAVCPFSAGSQGRGFLGPSEEGGVQDLDDEHGPVVATVDEVFPDDGIDMVVTPDSASSSSSTLKPFSEMPSPGGLRDCPVVGALFNFKPFSTY